MAPPILLSDVARVLGAELLVLTVRA
jgi:hypothetical protein